MESHQAISVRLHHPANNGEVPVSRDMRPKLAHNIAGSGNLVVSRCGSNHRISSSLTTVATAPRTDESVSVPLDNATVLLPANNVVYAFSNAIVGQAARVHASTGPAVSVSSDRMNAP